MNYNKIYISIISKAQSRKKLDGYIEKHHIIPRSFGGSDDDSNIVALTAREHFLAHFCLWKFSEKGTEARRSMAFAFHAMKMDRHGQRYVNSKLYASFKEDLAKAVSVQFKGKVISKAHKAKISLGNKGKVTSAETKAKIGAAHKGKKHTPERVKKIQDILARNRLLMTPAKKIAKRRAKRIAYWKEKELIESNT